jgi:hypothetical protein
MMQSTTPHNANRAAMLIVLPGNQPLVWFGIWPPGPTVGHLSGPMVGHGPLGEAVGGLLNQEESSAAVYIGHVPWNAPVFTLAFCP